MEVIIDLSQIKSPHDFYAQLTKQVDFGAFFGRNLNAFWDYIGLLEEKKYLLLIILCWTIACMTLLRKLYLWSMNII